MNEFVLLILVVICAALLLAERMGLRTTLSLDFKGDIKRETRWLAQYGQSVCTPVAGVLVWQLDPRADGWLRALVVVGAVLGVSIVALVLKRLFSRVRPGREQAGKFLGPSWRHANWKESFPSSHSACAFALSATLVQVWPAGYATFFTLAWVCAILRWLQDAHFPSDVLFGIVIGYVIGNTGALLLTHWFALV